MRKPKESVGHALQMNFEGLLFPQVGRNLKKFFNVEVNDRSMERCSSKMIIFTVIILVLVLLFSASSIA